MNIRSTFERIARDNLSNNGIYPPTEAVMNEAKLSAAQRAYDNRMPDDEGDRLDAWVDHIMGCRDELADVLEEHYTRPIAEFLAYALTTDDLPKAVCDRSVVLFARGEISDLVEAYCRKTLAEPTGAQMDAYDEREGGN